MRKYIKLRLHAVANSESNSNVQNELKYSLGLHKYYLDEYKTLKH